MKLHEQSCKIFFTFFYIGLVTIGGGYAMVPLIEDKVVEQYGWISKEEMMQILLVSESTPGPLAINTATFVGYQVQKVSGSFLATAGVVLPSFLIIYGLSFAYTALLDNTLFAHGFLGVKSGVIFLLCRTLLSLSKPLEKTPLSMGLFFLIFFLAFFTEVGVLPLIVLSIFLSMVHVFWKTKRDGGLLK